MCYLIYEIPRLIGLGIFCVLKYVTNIINETLLSNHYEMKYVQNSLWRYALKSEKEVTMIELNINNLTKYYGATKLFENITFEVKTGERIGFIGKNGCGKTTIMKILMGDEEYQGGEISLRKGIRVGYLDQIPMYGKETRTMEVIRLAFLPTFQIKEQMLRLESALGELSGEDLEKAVLRYGKLSEQYEMNGGYELETRINKITEGLKITEELKQMSFEKISGGEKTRVILAKILLEEPDILLLDEPTNHLDLETSQWLESFLKDYKGAVLVISHDRFFLDSVVNKIIELESNRANIYLGNYSYYVVEKERRFLIDYRNYLNQQKKIEQMERQIERYRIWGEMRDSDKMFRRAKELEKRLERMEVLDSPIQDKRKVNLRQETVNRTGKIVVSIEHLNKSFFEKPLLQEVNTEIYYQDSACIIGKNGSGKTTFLKMILGEEMPDKGIIKLGSQVKIGYLPQSVIFEEEEQTILEYFTREHDTTYEIARNRLAKVLFFKEDVNKKIKFLSGGEKSRLRLASLTFEKVNVMILDEPTNHLDIDSREVLEDTLLEFEGTLLFVSHDRYFINKVADKILSLEDCKIKIYPGNYSNYMEEYQKALLNKEKESGKQNGKPSRKDNGKENEKIDKKSRGEIDNNQIENEIKKIRKKSYGNPDLKKSCFINPSDVYKTKDFKTSTKQLEKLEKFIEEMEEKVKLLDNEMVIYNNDVNQLNELFKEKEGYNKELELAYERWEQIQEKLCDSI